ncbi:lipopolysaccharide biosynthesis protein [Methylomonas fluvii]|uniref:Polysaccharide biosynthesis protein n=1 Tax=Methylomonas fluvii TaxID=1854564 RepID=A0ABR9D9T6_9GAMM|nr:hypothetical protein [Methylomonas fluvii]MBD9359865.1 hypothetical protein [Methylomonas fluvii]CAD6872630.1 hypothetical protein [Methylomonas fluvii]
MKAVRKDAVYGILDQGLISLSNLGIGFLLIKLTNKESYGMYGVGFSVILLCVGVINSLITTQMAVFSPEKPDKKIYCLSMFFAQCIILSFIWLVFAILISALHCANFVNADIFIYSLIVSVSVLTATFHEFVRRYFYVALKPVRVLQIDIINSVVIFLALFFAIYLKISLSHRTAIGIYGCGAFVAGLAGLMLAGLIKKIKLIDIFSSISECWQHSQWAIGGTIVSWMQTQGYVAMLSIFASAAAIAEANAARLFLAPVGFVSTGLVMVFMPRLAILRKEGESLALIHMAQKMLMFIIGVIFIVSMLTFIVKDYVISFAFPKEYHNVGELVILWAIVFFAQAVRNNAAILLQIYKKFKVVTIYNFLTAIFTIFMTVIFVKIRGVEGSILAIALGELVLAFFLWRAFHYYSLEK